jgi:predicted transcriptional regulator
MPEVRTVNLMVRIPETLRAQAQATAKLRGENVSQVVRLALRDYVQGALEDARDLREVMALEARIDAGLEPVFSHEDVWAEIEALETRGELPA